MKKIMYVIPTLNVGGAEKLVINLVNKINKNKFEPIILLFYNNKNYLENLIEQDIKIIKLDKKRGLDLSMFKKVHNVIKEEKPDIIHAHLDTLLYLMPYLHKIKRKIFTVHNMANEEAVGLQRLVRYACFKLKLIEPIGLSPTVSESIEQLYNLKNVKYVYNGINVQQYFSSYKTNVFNIIAVGTLKPQKNYEMMIEVAKKLKDNGLNYTLHILGDGTLKNDISNKIHRYNLEENIILHGAVNNVSYYLSKADILISTSNYEGIPLSILEALASSLPVICTDVGGNVDLIFNGENGFLIEKGNVNKMVKSIIEIYKNEDKRKEMALNAREKSKKYDISNTMVEYEKLYKEC